MKRAVKKLQREEKVEDKKFQEKDRFEENVRQMNKSYERRLKNYKKVKNRIFGTELDKNKLTKIRETRKKFKDKKEEFDEIKEAVKICSAIDIRTENDPRAYGEIFIGTNKVRGLLDTGASISLLGKNCEELLDKLNIEITPKYSNVKTAGGKNCAILGKIEVPVEFKGKVKNIVFYICPELMQSAYLGVDFWRIFNLAPEIFSVCEIQPEKLAEDFPLQLKEVEQHILTDKEKQELKRVQSLFKSYEEHGLGKTEVETHKIELIEGATPVKDRHYPVSPAVQELIYAEVDQMLKLGVIEESQSPWSSRCTLVRKPGKNRLCLDDRKLNERTIKDAYPVQNIEGILSRLDETH